MASLKVLRFPDLKAAQIVTNWSQLRRLIDGHGFPPGYLLGSHTRVWDEAAVEGWLQSRRELAEAAASKAA